jgi:hypothetical protein
MSGVHTDGHTTKPIWCSCLISDNGSQFIGNQFEGFRADCGLTQRRTSVNYPQANGKIERHLLITKELLRQRFIIDQQLRHSPVCLQVSLVCPV